MAWFLGGKEACEKISVCDKHRIALTFNTSGFEVLRQRLLTRNDRLAMLLKAKNIISSFDAQRLIDKKKAS